MKKALVIGSGLAGSTAAWKLASEGWNVEVHEAGLEVGGHVRTSEFNGLLYEQNGIHVFHTNIGQAFEFLSRFATLIDYKHVVLTEVEGTAITWPLQLDELKRLSAWPTIEKEIIQLPIQPDFGNFESYAISIMGPTLYQLFIYPYTKKHWGVEPRLLSSSFAPKRIDLRSDGERPLFKDLWQGWPDGGWTRVIEGMLTEFPIHLILGRKDTVQTVEWDEYDAVIVTAPLDEFMGEESLPWRGVQVEHHYLPEINYYLAAGQVNHPGLDKSYTRRTETKWMSGQTKTSGTMVTYEFPNDLLKHYPVDDSAGKNRLRANKLKSMLRDRFPNAVIAGRLANYVYINTDQAIMQGLNAADQAIKIADRK
jgi:UDP-galactopyranose mutase